VLSSLVDMLPPEPRITVHVHARVEEEAYQLSPMFFFFESIYETDWSTLSKTVSCIGM